MIQTEESLKAFKQNEIIIQAVGKINKKVEWRLGIDKLLF